MPRQYELFAASYLARLRSVVRTDGEFADRAESPSAIDQWRRFSDVAAAESYFAAMRCRATGLVDGAAWRAVPGMATARDEAGATTTEVVSRGLDT